MAGSTADPQKYQLLQDVLNRLVAAYQGSDPKQIKETEQEFLEYFLPIGLQYCWHIHKTTGMSLHDTTGYAHGGVGDALIAIRQIATGNRVRKKPGFAEITVSYVRTIIYRRCFDIIQNDQSILSPGGGKTTIRGRERLLYHPLDEPKVTQSGEISSEPSGSPEEDLDPEKILSIKEGPEKRPRSTAEVTQDTDAGEQTGGDKTEREGASTPEAERSLRDMLLEICSDTKRHLRFVDDYLVTAAKRLVLFERWKAAIQANPQASERSLNPAVRDWYCETFKVDRGTYDKAKSDLKKDMAQFLSSTDNH